MSTEMERKRIVENWRQAGANFLAKYTDKERIPILHENRDWEEISLALSGFNSVVGLPTMEAWLCILHVAVENVYIMGYKRGLAQKNMPKFIVKE